MPRVVVPSALSLESPSPLMQKWRVSLGGQPLCRQLSGWVTAQTHGKLLFSLLHQGEEGLSGEVLHRSCWTPTRVPLAQPVDCSRHPLMLLRGVLGPQPVRNHMHILRDFLQCLRGRGVRLSSQAHSGDPPSSTRGCTSFCTAPAPCMLPRVTPTPIT